MRCWPCSWSSSGQACGCSDLWVVAEHIGRQLDAKAIGCFFGCHIDLRKIGQPIAWGTHASGLTLLGRYVTDGLGLDREKDFKAVYLDKAGDGAQATVILTRVAGQQVVLVVDPA